MALTRQGRFADLEQPHILFGASGHCGKTYGIRTAAVHILGTLRQQGFPGLTHTIFCQNYPELRDRFVPDMIAEFNDTVAEGEYHEKDSVYGMCYEFNDRSLGRILLRNVDSYQIGKRRGTESPGGIQVDELTQISREAFEHLRYGLRGSCFVNGRRIAVPAPPFGAATNPDGPHTGWVRRLWVPGYQDDAELLFDLIPRRNFLLIKSRPTDNPVHSPHVEAFLRGFSDPMLVKSRWEGSWDIIGGSRFAHFNRKVHGFTWKQFWTYYDLPRDLSLEQFLARCEDYGFALYGSFDYGDSPQSASAFHLHLVDWDQKVWTFGELYMVGLLLGTQARMLEAHKAGLPVRITYCDPALRGTVKLDDQRGIATIDKFAARGTPMKAGNSDRVEGWGTMSLMLEYESSEGVLISEPQWRICDEPPITMVTEASQRLKGGCTKLIQFLTDAPRDPNNLQDVDKAFGEDHAGDGVRYFLHTHFGRGIIKRKKPVMFSGAWFREKARAGRQTENSWGLR